MGDLLLQVTLYGVAAALAAPIALVVTALILGKSKRPLLSAWTFVAGALLLDLVITIAVFASGVFDTTSDLTSGPTSTSRSAPSLPEWG